MERVVIVGSGVFGASLAWFLARRGDEVVLVDQFAPGDERATSGGETRLIRCSHGADSLYAASARRAWELWRSLEADVIVPCGVCWFARREDGWEAASEPVLRSLGIPVELLDEPPFPSVRTQDLAFTLFEPEAGVLRAASAVRALVRESGVEILRARARPLPSAAAVGLDGGAALEGDRVVWACGGWLGELFPALVTLRVTRQELFFFDGGDAWTGVPAWVDFDGACYGTGDLDSLGVKAAWDGEGPLLAPDAPLPAASPQGEAGIRAYLAHRFPALARAPLRGARTCRYELSVDSHFIVARHPEVASWWLVGGGSGHGFKHGPAVAERLCAAWHDGVALPAEWELRSRVPGGSLRTAGTP